MIIKRFIQLKRLTHGSNKGFTLLELLVASFVSLVVLGLSLRLIVDQRQLFVKDQERTQVNQNLRVAIDLVGTDIKQTGERLVGTPLAVVQVINGAGASPDRLKLQRRVISEVLPVCQPVSGSQSTIIVSLSIAPPNPANPVCPFSNGNADPLPDNLQQWRDTRCRQDSIDGCYRTTNITVNDSCLAQGGSDRECLWAYIYNPANGQGEFFHYAFESSVTSSGTTQYLIHRAPSNPGSPSNNSTTPNNNVWRSTYPYTAPTPANPNPTNPIIYVLEEREYRLENNPNPSFPGDKVLELILNQQDSNNKPIRLVNQLRDFQVQAFLVSAPSVPVDVFNAITPVPPATFSNWQTIKAIKVELKEKVEPSDLTPNQIVSSKFFPRNAASDN